MSISAVWINRLAGLNDALVAQSASPLLTYLPPEPVPDAHWIDVSPSVAAALGWALSDVPTPEALRVFSGQALWPGMRSLASVYSGHQFGQWAGQLGDGRAHLLGEVKTPTGSQEIQLKGAGRTPYSRGGDGRAVLRSSIREYLCSEAMHGLGIPSTRALCLTASSLPVFRETQETAAIVTRVAPSFLRFGHFEHFAYQAAPNARTTLQALVAFVLREHLPQKPVSVDAAEDAAESALTLLAHACESTADLMAQWQAVGFCHGVMNTDNMSILGLTMDYGPFGFLDAFDPDHICNHSDSAGRYSWRNQPEVAWWNLAALAQALSVMVPGADDDKGEARQALTNTLNIFPKRYREQMAQRWQAKLGLQTSQTDDAALIQDWLSLLAQGKVDFTIAFRRLGQWRSQAPVDAASNALVRDLFLDREAFDAWAMRYNARLQAEFSVDEERCQRMDRVNPWVVLRNHLAQQAIERAQVGDYAEVKRLREVLASPYAVQEAHAADADFPPDWSASLSVSCSS